MQPITIENLKAAGFFVTNSNYRKGVLMACFPGKKDSGVKIECEIKSDVLTACFVNFFDLWTEGANIYPENMADIEALKRMLTPK